MTTDDAVRGRTYAGSYTGMSFGRGAQVAGLAGGLAGGGVLYAAAFGYLLSVGAVVGSPSAGSGLVLVVGLGAALGLLFGAALAALYVDRRALADTAPAAGILYGVVLAVALGAVGLPELVSARTQYTLAVPNASAPALLAWIAYGGVLGAVARAVFLQLPVPEHRSVTGTTEGGGVLDAEELRAAVVGSLAGGLVGGAALYALAGSLYLQYVGAVTRLGGSTARGFAGWLVLSLVLGAVFALLAARTTTAYANSVIALTSRNETLRRLVLPSVRRAPLTTTAANMGLAYGVAAGIVVGVLALPALVTGTTALDFVSPWSPVAVVLGFALYGVALGAGYGASLEGTLPASGATSGGNLGTAAVGGLAGGAVAGVLLYAVAPTHLAILGAVAGSNSAGVGFAVFLVLAVLLGLVFSATVARGVGPGGSVSGFTAAGAGYGIAVALLVGALAVPVLVGAVTPFEPAVPLTTPPVLFAYVVYGVALGAAYGAARGAVDATAATGTGRGRGNWRAGVFGALLGGFLGGLVIHHVAGPPLHMRYVGAPVGLGGSVTRGWGAWMLLSLALGAAFVLTAGRRLDAHAASDDSPTPGNAPRPGGQDAPVVTTATLAGFAYGVVVAVVVAGLAVPLLVNILSGASLPMPSVRGAVWLGYVVYGAALGFGYGALVEG